MGHHELCTNLNEIAIISYQKFSLDEDECTKMQHTILDTCVILLCSILKHSSQTYFNVFPKYQAWLLTMTIIQGPQSSEI